MNKQSFKIIYDHKDVSGESRMLGNAEDLITLLLDEDINIISINIVEA